MLLTQTSQTRCRNRKSYIYIARSEFFFPYLPRSQWRICRLWWLTACRHCFIDSLWCNIIFAVFKAEELPFYCFAFSYRNTEIFFQENAQLAKSLGYFTFRRNDFFIPNYLLKQKLTAAADTAAVAWTNILSKADNFPKAWYLHSLWKDQNKSTVWSSQCEHVAFFLLWGNQTALDPDQIPSYL